MAACSLLARAIFSGLIISLIMSGLLRSCLQKKTSVTPDAILRLQSSEPNLQSVQMHEPMMKCGCKVRYPSCGVWQVLHQPHGWWRLRYAVSVHAIQVELVNDAVVLRRDNNIVK